MEQKPDPVLSAHDAADLRRMATDATVAPHVRFQLLLAAHGLNDAAAAGLLQVERPTVCRTRLGDRLPSFDVAARVEALLGIPAVHWRPVPAILNTSAKALATAANERAKANKPRARKTAR